MADIVAFSQPGRSTMIPKSTLDERAEPGVAPERLQQLHARPGFLIRRLHHLHSALFIEECRLETITPIMYSVLMTLDAVSPLDQTTLVAQVAIDKTNMADTLERLRKRGLVERHVFEKDRRVRLATITNAGRDVVRRLDDKVQRAHDRTIEALSPHEREVFIRLMTKIVAASREEAE